MGLRGFIWSSYKIIKTDELMKKGHLATLDINVLLLKHSPNKFETFEDEVQYIIGHKKRNRFIRNRIRSKRQYSYTFAKFELAWTTII